MLFLHNIGSNKNLYIVNISEIINSVNWSRNRPPDMIRVEEIKNYFSENNLNTVPGIVSVFEKNNQFYIYDGSHRFEASKILFKDSNVNMLILLSILRPFSEQEIIEDFQTINYARSIPQLYIEQNIDETKRDFCEKIADKLSKKFPKFVSTKKPNAPNFNRDMLIEFISDFDIDFKDHQKMFKLLMELNDISKERKGILGVPKKVIEYDFYLFYLKNDFIQNYIESRF